MRTTKKLLIGSLAASIALAEPAVIPQTVQVAENEVLKR